ncbi:CatB-related O-acetyltransferase [Weissella paramesenteroides]|uniref:CatB-related O-acetyltransferase n=1 Tax=Weissella paramesenteroides TaxID=1249 RepID=UPI00240283A9|nr:CatB-related O-acetyltransferase [Weissella paramesenteroides]MDF8367415.1 CatB-related O-acetyltransferase [Weissella paramesenteroides]
MYFNDYKYSESNSVGTIENSKELQEKLSKFKIYVRNYSNYGIIESARIESYARFFYGNVLHTMGAFSYSSSRLPANTIVGRYSSIATGVSRMGAAHPIDRFTTSNITYEQSKNAAFNRYISDNDIDLEYHLSPLTESVAKPVMIGNDVWIGDGVLFTNKGIKVGDGSIIGARSIITKDVEPYSIVVGANRVVRQRFSDSIIKDLLDLQWWQYDFSSFSNVSGDDNIEVFIEKIKYLIKTDKLRILDVPTWERKDLF